MNRSATLLLACFFLLAGAGCGQFTPTAPGMSQSAAPLPSMARLPEDLGVSLGETVLATFSLQIDEHLQTQVELLAERNGSFNEGQGDLFDMDLADALEETGQFDPRLFRIKSLSLEPVTSNLIIEFTHTHVLPGPKVFPQGGWANRADLGYTGRLVLLSDVVGIPPAALFGKVANTGTFVGVDGYMSVTSPATNGIIGTSELPTKPPDGFAANLFPYVLLADDGLDGFQGNRYADDLAFARIPNNPLTPRGNYADTPEGGWTTANWATLQGIADPLRWTGFDFVHQGQTVKNSFIITNEALQQPGGLNLIVALVVKYTDPKKWSAPQTEANGSAPNPIYPRELFRPTDPNAPLDFAYRLPHAALDASVLTTVPRYETTATSPNPPVALTVRDWDAEATPTTEDVLRMDPDWTTVAADADGYPGVDFLCPGLNPTPAIMIAGDPGDNAGHPDNPLLYGSVLTDTLMPPCGIYPAMFRVVDNEPLRGTFPSTDPYRTFGIIPDPVNPIQPFTADKDWALKAETYQPAEVVVCPTLLSAGVTTTVCGAQGVASATLNRPIGTLPHTFTWSFGGGAVTENLNDAMPTVQFLSPGTYPASLTLNCPDCSVPTQSIMFNYTVTNATIPVISAPTGGTVSRSFPDEIGKATAITEVPTSVGNTTFSGNIIILTEDFMIRPPETQPRAAIHFYLFDPAAGVGGSFSDQGLLTAAAIAPVGSRIHDIELVANIHGLTVLSSVFRDEGGVGETNDRAELHAFASPWPLASWNTRLAATKLGGRRLTQSTGPPNFGIEEGADQFDLVQVDESKPGAGTTSTFVTAFYQLDDFGATARTGTLAVEYLSVLWSGSNPPLFASANGPTTIVENSNTGLDPAIVCYGATNEFLTVSFRDAGPSFDRLMAISGQSRIENSWGTPHPVDGTVPSLLTDEAHDTSIAALSISGVEVPIIAYQGGGIYGCGALKYCRAIQPSPDSAADWALPHIVQAGGLGCSPPGRGIDLNLVAADNQPLVSYIALGSIATFSGNLELMHSCISDPVLGGVAPPTDWQLTSIPTTGNLTGLDHALALFGPPSAPRFIIGYQDLSSQGSTFTLGVSDSPW